jgi:hypothetical protein
MNVAFCMDMGKSLGTPPHHIRKELGSTMDSEDSMRSIIQGINKHTHSIQGQ